MRPLRTAVALVVTGLLLPLAAQPAAATIPMPDPALSLTIGHYVDEVYWDLFDRAADPTGHGTWTWQLSTGTPRIAVANAITSSTEFRAGLIADAYDGWLGREPDAEGLQFWLRKMNSGLTIEQLDSGFIASDEYWADAGSTKAGWVRALYSDVLGRDAADAEVAAWVGQLDLGATRAQVAMGFLLSTEYLSSVVDGYYWWLLGRGLDPVGRTSWVSAIQQGSRDEQIIGGIVASDEYWTNATSRPFVSSILLSPHDASTVLGSGQYFEVTAYDRFGTPIDDVTAASTVEWDGQPCPDSYCVPASSGAHEVHAVYRGLNAFATLTVAPPN
ncbi:DUF4214 domain-containing protein [Cellulomonas sp. URHE0023]|uniref:DUF4214 domain-containing protein n=1 Tax=Cellulomonas sp. URHE0023 TaxID=1380354 RepID=UPI0004876FF4|nr:DUF4214 domain-containing protein [Cellulomonas sp. URHE0023]